MTILIASVTGDNLKDLLLSLPVHRALLKAPQDLLVPRLKWVYILHLHPSPVNC